MNDDYLHELIDEVKSRDGGVLLNVAGRVEAVVLSVDRYNELLFTKEKLSFPAVPRSVLVTGGAGYVGSHVVRHLLAAGNRVAIIDNLSSGTVECVPETASFFEIDLNDTAMVRRVLREQQVDMVIHAAGRHKDYETPGVAAAYMSDNVDATRSLLEAMVMAGTRDIIFSSSAAVYGNSGGLPWTENSPLMPQGAFGMSKALAEGLISYYAQNMGMKAVILRYCHVGGADMAFIQHGQASADIVSSIRRVLAKAEETATIFGNDFNTFDGTKIRNYVHVKDVARAHSAIAEALEQLPNFSVYNLGSDTSMSDEHIIRLAAEVTGKMIPLEFKQRQANEPAAVILDSSKIKNDIGFYLQYSDLRSMLFSE